MSTLTVLSLLAALDADQIETQVLILADALDECGRCQDAEWCRQFEIHPGLTECCWLVQGGGLPSAYPLKTIAAARAELLRRVREKVESDLKNTL